MTREEVVEFHDRRHEALDRLGPGLPPTGTLVQIGVFKVKPTSWP